MWQNPYFIETWGIYTAYDPFVIIDLDDKPAEEEERAARDLVYEKFPGYAEYSISGKGVHIILRGHVGDGKRRGLIEVYDRDRYMITTGNVLRDAPILDAPQELSILLSEMAAAVERDLGDSEPETRSDDAVIALVRGEPGGELYDYHPTPGEDWSTLDFGLCCRIVRHTMNHEQLYRVFAGSTLFRPEGKANVKPQQYHDNYLWKQTFPRVMATRRKFLQDTDQIRKNLLSAIPILEARAREAKEKGDDDPGPWTADSIKHKHTPPLEWLVDQMIPMGKVTILGGDGGTGKSLLALQLGIAVASATPWVELPVRSGAVLYVSAEDDTDDLERRTKAIGAAYGIDLERLNKLHVWSLVGRDTLLAELVNRSKLEPSKLYHRLRDEMEKVRGGLLVLDTSVDLFPGDEINRSQVKQFMQLLAKLALEFKCAVLLLSHPSVTGMNSGTGTSGSTAWSNAARSRLYFDRVKIKEKDRAEVEPDTNARTLKTKKNNYGPTDREVPLRFTNGVFSPGAVIPVAKPVENADAVFLELLDLLTTQKRRVNANGGTNYAPNVFAKHPQSGGFTAKAFRTSMDRLFASGTIANLEDGPPSKRTTYLARPDGGQPSDDSPSPPPSPENEGPSPPPSPLHPPSLPTPHTPIGGRRGPCRGLAPKKRRTPERAERENKT